MRTKLQRFWEAGIIQLMEFEDNKNVLTGQKAEEPAEEPAEKSAEDYLTKVNDRKWLVEGADEEFGSKKAALAFVEEMLKAGEETEDDETEDEDPLES